MTGYRCIDGVSSLLPVAWLSIAVRQPEVRSCRSTLVLCLTHLVRSEPSLVEEETHIYRWIDSETVQICFTLVSLSVFALFTFSFNPFFAGYIFPHIFHPHLPGDSNRKELLQVPFCSIIPLVLWYLKAKKVPTCQFKSAIKYNNSKSRIDTVGILDLNTLELLSWKPSSLQELNNSSHKEGSFVLRG